jgi:hypothetical protein
MLKADAIFGSSSKAALVVVVEILKDAIALLLLAARSSGHVWANGYL